MRAAKIISSPLAGEVRRGEEKINISSQGLSSLPLVVGITGASGVVYALRALEELARQDHPVDLVVSGLGSRLLLEEANLKAQDLVTPNVRLHSISDLGAVISTGSYRTRGMLVIPATTGTTGRIAAGTSDNLLVRAADVTLKERRLLVIVLRETPLSLVHLRACVSLAEAGAVILPASPGFYHKPTTMDDLVDFVVDRSLQQFGISYSRPTQYQNFRDAAAAATHAERTEKT